MSEVERLDLTAGGDAPVVETIKTDDAISQLTEYASEYIDVTSGNAIATKESEASTETTYLIKTNIEYMFEENANPSTYIVQPKITDIITENLTAKDASAVDTQTSVVEINSSTSITLQNEKMSQKSINEEKVRKRQSNKILLF